MILQLSSKEVFNPWLSKLQRGKSFKISANGDAGPGICDPLKRCYLIA